MKTKKEDKPEDDAVPETSAKTRARKRLADNEDKPEESGTASAKKNIIKRNVTLKRPLGVTKTLRSKKTLIAKSKVKAVVKQVAKPGRSALKRTGRVKSEPKEISIIPASDIKKEPEELSTGSRSSSPKTTPRRQRLTSDIQMMRSTLAESPTSLLLGSRTSPYSTRSERSNSPFRPDPPRAPRRGKLKNNLLNEIVRNEQKKRRLEADGSPDPDETKKKRGRSESHDDSEISNTESDLSLCEPDKEVKTEVDTDESQTSVPAPETCKIPFPVQCKTEDNQTSFTLLATKMEGIKRSASLDSDNNNRMKIDEHRASLGDKSQDDQKFCDRDNILNNMSRKFNTKEMMKNIRKVRRGRQTVSPRDKKTETLTQVQTEDPMSKEIDDLIQTLENCDKTDECPDTSVASHTVGKSADPNIKPVHKFYGAHADTPKATPRKSSPVPAKTAIVENAGDPELPKEAEEGENIRLQISDEESQDKTEDVLKENVGTTPLCLPVTPSIDKLMDKLKHFEELDKKRQQEQKAKESVRVTDDVVLIPKFGADIKPLKDIQATISNDKPIDKENVLSCFQNNSAISIVTKRDHVRKSVDVDLPNSITLIKRNPGSRKESTSSNSGDTLSILSAASLGKDVTLTELRRSVDIQYTPGADTAQQSVHSFAVITPNKPGTIPQSIANFGSSLSIISKEDKPQTNGNEKRKVILKRDRKSSLVVDDTLDKIKLDGVNSTIERIKSPPVADSRIKSPTCETIKSPHTEIVKCPTSELKSPEKEPSDKEVMKSPLPVKKSPSLEIKLNTTIPPTTEIKKLEPAVTLSSVAPDSAKGSIKSPEKVTPNPQNSIKIKSPENKAAKEDAKPVHLIPAIIVKISPEVAQSTPSPPPSKKSPETTPPPVEKQEPPKVKDPQPSTSGMLIETPERQKRKESILRTLGLLTLKAADEAQKEKQRQKEMYATKNSKMNSGESSGTLRTVIKLKSLGEKKSKGRSSLKMTFQKARAGKPSQEAGESDAQLYYTIHKEDGGAGVGGNATDGSEAPVLAAPSVVKDTPNLVIPEKASSFSIHPGRLCQDQCFYCGGNFGLFDTPCHIAQMKSAERQKKVLENEEKLTMDSCLCDACYRHVDRKANCPSYRKRTPGSSTDNTQVVAESAPSSDKDGGGGAGGVCHAEGCAEAAVHSIKRKWLIKMRNKVNQVVKLQSDYPGLHTIPLCAAHFAPVSQLMACSLCKRRLVKHHNIHFVSHNVEEINQRLAESGVPAQLTARAAVCKLCRYLCSLLHNNNNPHLLTLHKRRLLQIYNIEVPEEMETEAAVEEQNNLMEVDNNTTKTKKSKNKSSKNKQRKSTDSNRSSHHNSDNSQHEHSNHLQQESTSEAKHNIEPMEEDIESLISSNKISKGQDLSQNSDNSESDSVVEAETIITSLDKQSELQYLLQRQNNPAQFINAPPNLTQKQRNVLKAHNASAIQKPGTQAKICDKNAKRLQKIGQAILQKEKKEDSEGEKESVSNAQMKSITEECTIESLATKKPADIAVLKNKWQMSESFTQVKKNLSELSKSADKPKKADSKFSNPVKRLETNPSISVRELFPGEDEMNLQCSIEFNNVKGVTPEGWEKCTSTVQYDAETKKLWQELQKPYGNQSSFLRHLVLLEKYFRMGELVLSPNATGFAANYSDSVQNRLRAFDNVPEPKKTPAVSLLEYRKKPNTGKSLLKSNQSSDAPKPTEAKSGESKQPKPNFVPFPGLPPPPAVFVKPKPKASSEKPSKQKQAPPPPELISIHNQGRKSIENVLKNIQQLVKGVSAEPEPLAPAPAPAPALPPPPPPPPPAPAAPPKEKKQKTTTKPWRPTLMQITEENVARIAREQPQTAVDGRALPSLVQVMSGGQRYHISLADYNKMCIMRREKMHQVQVVMNKNKPTTEVVTEIQPSATHGNGGTVTQNVPVETSSTDEAVSNAANIIKNVGLKNITIAPVIEKPKTTSPATPPATSSSLLITSTPIKVPQLNSSLTITSDSPIGKMFPSTILPQYSATIQPLVMPKIPKSLTVIPQTVPVSSGVSMPPLGVEPSGAGVTAPLANLVVPISVPQQP